MFETIKDRLNELIAGIDHTRSEVERQRGELLLGDASDSGMGQLMAFKAELESLRLAEDVLGDAVAALSDARGQ